MTRCQRTEAAVAGLPGDSDSSDGEADDIANLRAYATVSMHEETDPLISDKEKPSFGTL